MSFFQGACYPPNGWISRPRLAWSSVCETVSWYSPRNQASLTDWVIALASLPHSFFTSFLEGMSAKEAIRPKGNLGGLYFVLVWKAPGFSPPSEFPFQPD